MTIKKGNIIKELIKEAISKKIVTDKRLQILKNSYCLKYKISPPANIELIKYYKELKADKNFKEDNGFEKLIRKRGVRTVSGIAPIAVLTKEYPCPGKCIYCPTEKDMPKSYLSNEPAVMRAILNDFNAYKQVKNRLSGLQRTGHSTNKNELIVIGGTWSYLPKQYQTNFIRQCFNALNYPLKKANTLKEAQKKNEKALNRCVGLTLETRPDFLNEKELIRMRELGCTRIEIGVQSIFNDILKKNKRGHLVEETIRATRLMKDAGFKVCYHLMPNLYGSTVKKDLEMFKQLWENPDFKPDHIKIYPCVITDFSELKKLWEQGKYKPYTDKQLLKLLVDIKRDIPEYVRIVRLIRDIPTESIIAGNMVPNLRQYLEGELAKTGDKCRCIRCREIKKENLDPINIEYKELIYDASGGQEFFLTYNDKKRDKLISLLRLRFPSNTKNHFAKELKNCSIIREVHTYGTVVPIANKDKTAFQHLGLGKKLIKKAEEVSKKAGFKKIAVISAVGTREYYKKLGYKLDGTYMIKNLTKAKK